MSNAIATQNLSADIIEKLVLGGDLSVLDAKQKVQYYASFCQRVGLDPATKPFQLLKLDGKEIMYADRGCAAQLNKLHEISHKIQSREVQNLGGHEYYVVCAVATNKDGRFVESIGAVSLFKEGGEWLTGSNGKRFFKKNGQILPLVGDEMSNAIMKAETKAKRRATLDLVGLGVLDEAETEAVNITNAQFEIVPNAEPAGHTEPPPPPMTVDDNLYRTATNDADLIVELIDKATNPGLLRTFYTVNMKFFKSNPELADRIIQKGNELKGRAA